jgi:hypothetical protein
MVELADLAADLRFEFPDFPARTLVHYLRRAAALMCREGDLARRLLPLRTRPGVEAYRLGVPEGVSVSSVMAVRDLRDGRAVTRHMREPARDADDAAWFVPPDELHFRSRSSVPRDLEVEVSVVPGPEAWALDEPLAVEHYEVLLAGARSLIYSVGGKPWFSPELAEANRLSFTNGVAAAKTAMLTGRQKGVWRKLNGRVL